MADLGPGVVLGPYAIERLLGRGGMGAVYLAFDNLLHRHVALKVLSDESGGPPRTQLLREARSAAALNHPGICTVYDVADAAGAAFIAMEYVDGLPLHITLEAGPLPVAQAFHYGIQAADALAFAHQYGVIHRDFKSANVMVTAGGRVKIIDFGLARRDRPAVGVATTVVTVVPSGSIAGTPYAMAPEQVRGEAADARSDVWALGVVLYEMASGAKPFRAARPADLFSAILRDPPPPLPASVPPALAAIIDRCLAKEPAARYQHAGEVHAALEAARHASAVAPSLPAASRRRWWLWPAAAAAVALMAIAANSVRNVLPGLRGPATMRLAVLPLENLTGDASQEFLSDGLTEEIIGQLGRLHPERLSVIARTSSMQYKNRALPVSQIGRELGVDYILEGSARREGNRVRVTTTLVQVADQAQKWTDTFERDVSGLITLQNDVAKGVAQSLELALLPDERGRLDQTQAVQPEAYEAYLRGRSHAIKLTRNDLDTALRYYEVALQKDPSYALAWAGVAAVWSARQQMGFVPPSTAAPAMKAAASRAIALDDSSSEAHLRLANQAVWTDWNWSEGEREFKRAIALGPNNSEAHAFYGHFLYIMHRPGEAQPEMERALAMDPLSEQIQSLYGTTLLYRSRYAEAVSNARNILKTTPASGQALNQIAQASFALGDLDGALAAEKQFWRARNDREIEVALDAGFAQGGFQQAMRRAANILASRTERNAGLNRIAVTYVKAGAYDEAFAMLEKSFAARDPNIPYLSIGPAWNPIRKDPRFKSLIRRLSLPE